MGTNPQGKLLLHTPKHACVTISYPRLLNHTSTPKKGYEVEICPKSSRGQLSFHSAPQPYQSRREDFLKTSPLMVARNAHLKLSSTKSINKPTLIHPISQKAPLNPHPIPSHPINRTQSFPNQEPRFPTPTQSAQPNAKGLCPHQHA